MEWIENFGCKPIGSDVRCPLPMVHGPEDRQIPPGDAEMLCGAFGPIMIPPCRENPVLSVAWTACDRAASKEIRSPGARGPLLRRARIRRPRKLWIR